MRFYETGLIFDPTLDDAGFDSEVKKITDLIQTNSGQVLKVDRWGVRRLSYPIRKKSQAYYAFVYYDAPPQVPALIDSNLRINEFCLRFMTIVPDYKPEFERTGAAGQAARPEVAPQSYHRAEPEAPEKSEDVEADRFSEFDDDRPDKY